MATKALPAPNSRKFPKITAAAAAEMAVPLAVLAIVVALITPMPPFLLDLLLVIDIMLSVIVLMVSLYLTKAVEFSVFPTTLLILTLFRLHHSWRTPCLANGRHEKSNSFFGTLAHG